MADKTDRAGTSTRAPSGLPQDAEAVPPPFTPEQLTWIDHLIVSRQSQQSGEKDTRETAPHPQSGDPLPTATSSGETHLHDHALLGGGGGGGLG